MEKTEENIKQIAEYFINREKASPDLDLTAFIQAYLAGEDYTPANFEELVLIPMIQDALWIQFERYKPSQKRAWEDSAPRIPVKVGGREFQTFIDEQGVQRFCSNSVITHLMSSNARDGILSLNNLSLEYDSGKFSSDDWLDFMTSFGYSVTGLLDWEEFTHLPVENPLWED